MQGNLPPEAQEKLEELQDLQEKAQQVAAQKQQAETCWAFSWRSCSSSSFSCASGGRLPCIHRSA